MSVPMQTFLSELQTALLTTGVSVKLRRNMVMDKVRTSAARHIIVVPNTDVVTKPESTASYIVTCSATVRLCVVDNTDADAITALTSLWSTVRQATYGKAWSGRKYVQPETDGEFTPDPETSNLYYLEVTFYAEYQESLVPLTVPDVAGLTEAAANTAILAANLVPDSDGAYSGSVAKGLVISQSPAAGTAAYAGDIVTITVSFGVEYKIVPVTKDSTPAVAAAALVAAGLVLGTSASEMTDDTAAGLVASSSPAAGTGVAAGTAVNLTVSLGDLHTRIPINVVPGRTANIMVTTTGGATFYWLLPGGTTAAGTSGVYYSSYTAPLGATDAIIYCVMNTGYTTSQIIGFEGESSTNGARFCLDYLKHIRVTAAQRIWLNSTYGAVYGDIANLASSLAAGSTIYINILYSQDGIYGDMSALPPLSLYNCYYWTRVYGSLTPHSTCAIIRMLNVLGPSFAEISQTIINWNAANPATFARTGIFNFYKRSQLTAAGEAAVVALIAKGCAFTFKAE